MRVVTVTLALTIAGMGGLAGGVGALLGIGGGVFLVPLLNLAAAFPLRTLAAISLLTVIATSSAVSARRVGTGVINLRLVIALAGHPAAGRLFLHAGVMALLATPVVRVSLSAATYAVQRDWVFAAMVAIVLVELLMGVVAALRAYAGPV